MLPDMRELSRATIAPPDLVAATLAFGGRPVVTLPSQPSTDIVWRETAEQVLTECLRRLCGGIRDWSPLLVRTRHGVPVEGLSSEERAQARTAYLSG